MSWWRDPRFVTTVALVAALPAVLVGPTPMDPALVLELRMPRLAGGMAAGAVLALAGSLLQSLFLNPLVSPYTLGTASVASLGAALCMFAGAPPHLGASVAMVLHAFFLRAMGTRTGWSPSRLVLAGVALSFLAGGAISLLQYLAPYSTALSVLHWLMGELAFLTHWDALLLAAVLAMALPLLRLAPHLDVISLGRFEAAASGVDVPRVTALVLLGTSLAVGLVIALTGPLPFVGLVAPHLARLMGFRRTLPNAVVAMAIGANLLVWSDAAARTIVAGEIPVGIMTSLLGALFFLVLVLRRTT